jgi:hypothetical protein
MSPQQEAVALWKYLESRGAKPSVRQVGRLLRSELKLRFRETELRGWLSAFGTRPGRKSVSVGTQKSSTGDAACTHSGRKADATSREKEVSLFSQESSVLRTSSSGNGKPSPVAANGKVRSLPLPRPELDARVAILRAVWLHVEPVIGRSTTWTDWKRRNTRVADSFVHGGYSPEQIVAAWECACRKESEPVRELSRVQRFLEELAVYRARKAAEA